MELSVIVPVFNEEEHLWSSLEGLAASLDRIIGSGSWEYVIANNGSRDASSKIIEKACARWNLTRRIDLPAPNIGEALKHGLDAASGDFAYIINVDAWDAEFLSQAWSRRQHHDLIIGSKRLHPERSEIQFHRRVLSWGLNTILQRRLHFVGSDTHGQKLLHLPALRPILKQTVLRRGQFDTEFTLRAQRAGLRTAEMPIRIREIRPPRNAMTRKIVQNLFDLWTLSRILPVKLDWKLSVNHRVYPK